MDTPAPIRLVIVDDHAVVRSGVWAVFLGEPRFTVVGEAATVAQAVAVVRETQPDVVLLDVNLPDGSGLGAVGRLRAESPKTRVLMLSVHDGREYVLEAVRADASGYLRKDATPALLREAVAAVHAGGSFFGAEVVGHLAAAIRGDAESPDASLLDRLTTREREVLALVAQGKTSKEIALALGISVRTAESHRDSIGKKTGLRSVAALTKLSLSGR